MNPWPVGAVIAGLLVIAALVWLFNTVTAPIWDRLVTCNDADCDRCVTP